MLKNLYCIVGPSGSGKTTVAEILSDTYGYQQVWSFTTRPARSSDEKGHIFVSQEEFDRIRSDLVAYTKFNNFEYGITREILNTKDLYVIDPRGVDTLRERYPERKIIVIYLEVPSKECALRMRARGDSEEKIGDRLVSDEKDFAPWVIRRMQPDAVVSGDGTQREVAEKVKKIIDAYEA